MIIHPLFTDTVTIHRAALVDARGTKERDWTTETTITISNCSIQEQASSGEINERTSNRTQARLFAQLGADIQRADRVEFGGVLYTVIGDPVKMHQEPLPHLEITLEKWEG